MFRIILLVVILGVAGLLAYVRLAPLPPEVWNTDPLTAPLPTTGGWLVKPEGGNAVSPVLALDATAALAAVDAIAMAEPRTTRLAGSPEEGRITYVTRSRLMGFPDMTTVSTIPEGDGSAIVIYARQRFGQGDMGVNRARVERWLLQLNGPAT